MENSKLIKSLKCLSQEEIQSFRAFVHSPYFNSSQKLIIFLDTILAGYMTEDGLPGRAKQSKAFAGSRVQDIMHRLMNLLEQFLAFEKMKENAFIQKLHLMNAAYEKEIGPMIKGIEKDLDTLLDQRTFRDNNYFYESYQIHAERDYSFRILGKITENSSLQNKTGQLDLFYLSLKLKDSCELLNRRNIVSANYDFRLADTLVGYLKEYPEGYQEHPAIKIYLDIYTMLSEEENESYFFSLVELVRKNEAFFPQEELLTMYTYLQNYCIRRVNQAKPQFFLHLFEIYKHILGNGLVFGNNKNMQWDFKNFVSLGLRIKEYDWTLNIIDQFKDKLPSFIKVNAYSYNLANYYYETGAYKKATKLLNSVDFTDIYYSLGAKAMLLKIYYQVEEAESFYALVSSFGIYLRRNKLISKDNLEVYNNLLRFTKKAFILKTKLPYEQKKDHFKKIGLLKQALQSTQKVANINWLMEELEILGKAGNLSD